MCFSSVFQASDVGSEKLFSPTAPKGKSILWVSHVIFLAMDVDLDMIKLDLTFLPHKLVLETKYTSGLLINIQDTSIVHIAL